MKVKVEDQVKRINISFSALTWTLAYSVSLTAALFGEMRVLARWGGWVTTEVFLTILANQKGFSTVP